MASHSADRAVGQDPMVEIAQRGYNSINLKRAGRLSCKAPGNYCAINLHTTRSMRVSTFLLSRSFEAVITERIRPLYRTSHVQVSPAQDAGLNSITMIQA